MVEPAVTGVICQRLHRHGNDLETRWDLALPFKRVDPDSVAAPLGFQCNTQKVTLQTTVGEILEQRESDRLWRLGSLFKFSQSNPLYLLRRLQMQGVDVGVFSKLPADREPSLSIGIFEHRGQTIVQLSLPERCADQLAHASLFDIVRIPAVLRYQHWQPCHNGFKQDNTCRLIKRWQDKEI